MSAQQSNVGQNWRKTIDTENDSTTWFLNGPRYRHRLAAVLGLHLSRHRHRLVLVFMLAFFLIHRLALAFMLAFSLLLLSV